MNDAMIYHFHQTSNLEQNEIPITARAKGEVVHSGHFMISSVADDQDENEVIDHNRDSPVDYERSIRISGGGYNFTDVAKETKDTYQFGPLPSDQITIDASLSRLFQCMSLAYQGGKVVSPKWKNFKGMKLTVKDKIRLNNAIWRTWHIQYIMRKKKEQSLIQFVTPLEVVDNNHTRPEAVVMEGKYWKRRIETVVEEYKKWRAFFTEKLRVTNYPGIVGNKWTSRNQRLSMSDVTGSDKQRNTDESVLNEFSDTLFSSLSQQPFQFPNPREIAMHATNSDIMQPSLLQLQPVMDDFMDFDPFQEFFQAPKKSVVHFSGSANQTFPQGSGDILSPSDLCHLFEQPVAAQQHVARSDVTPNSQSVDFMNTFGLPQNSVAGAPVLEPVTTAVTGFADSHVSSGFYSANGMQQPMPPQRLTAPAGEAQVEMVQGFNQTPTKQYITRTGNFQQPFPKQIQPENRTTTSFQSINSNGNALASVNIPQQFYPFSKSGAIASTSNVTYSQTQGSQIVHFNQQGQVSMQQNRTNISFPPAVRPQATRGTALHGHPHTPANKQQQQLSNFTHPVPETPNQQADLRQEPATEERIFTALPSDFESLKNLLTNATNPPFASNKRNSGTSNRTAVYQQAKALQQTAPATTVVTHASKNPLNWSVIPDPSVVISPPGLVVEKQKSLECPNLDARIQPSWQTSQSSSSSSPVKAIIEDIEMEKVNLDLESLSPLHHDIDDVQPEVQRQGSISTEQKRRSSIKQNFTRLQTLLPGCSYQTNVKISKASLMNKAAQHIKTLQAERTKMKEEIQTLKRELENLQLSINSSQQQLPATGAPVSKPRKEESRAKFQLWSRKRTKRDWKFFVFSVVVRPWFDAYQSTVSVQGRREFNRTLFEWIDKRCSLRNLRPNIVQSLQFLSTSTCVLTNPSNMRAQVERIIRQEEMGDAK